VLSLLKKNYEKTNYSCHWFNPVLDIPKKQILPILLSKTKEIQEVLLKSQKKKQFSDHANYTFDKEALEKRDTPKIY
jgi:hypothetical protein